MKSWKPSGVKLPPIGTRLNTSRLTNDLTPLACGHRALSEKDLGKPMCYACWLAEERAAVEAMEEEYGLTIEIIGKSEKQVFQARHIRALKVAGIAARIADGTHTDKLLEKLDEFRTESDAAWFFRQRFFKTAVRDDRKNKRARAQEEILAAVRAAISSDDGVSD